MNYNNDYCKCLLLAVIYQDNLYVLNKGLGGANAREIKELEAELKQIVEAIQTHRKKAGFSQEKLAELLEVNVNTIKYIEQRRRLPSLPMLIRICWKIGLEIRLGKKS